MIRANFKFLLPETKLKDPKNPTKRQKEIFTNLPSSHISKKIRELLSDPSPFLPYSCEEFYFICIWKKFIRWGGRCPAAQTRPRPSPTRIINVLNEIQGKFKSVEGEKKGGGERLRFVHSATYVSTSRPPRSFNSRENDPSPLYPSRVRRCETEPKPNSYKICHRAIVLSLSLSPLPSHLSWDFSFPEV